MRWQRVRQVAGVLAGAMLALAGCASGRRGEGDRAGDVDPGQTEGTLDTDATRVYQQMGLLASPGPVPFVGSVAYLAGPSPDTTVALVTLSLANRALTFAREGQAYQAGYTVQLDLRQGAAVTRHVEAHEIVRVGAFRETSRADESVIFQQVLNVAPGQYVLSFAVRDAGAGRSATQEAPLTVPRLGAGDLSTPITVFDATPRTSPDSLPRLVASPRSTAAFGRDTLMPIYLEGYGAGADSGLHVAVAVLGERSTPVWRDTVTLARRGGLFSGVIDVPVSSIGVGINTLVASRADTPDTTRTPLFVSFGEGLPVASFTEMLDYLRYFASPPRLQALRTAPPEQRAEAWSTFLKQTDPVPATAQHEGLRDYFARVQQANARFRDEGGVGWLSDRGVAYVALGEPDQIFEQGGTDVNQRGRAQVWEYREHQLQLVFIDQTGFGRWRLTPGSQAELQAAIRRLQAR